MQKNQERKGYGINRERSNIAILFAFYLIFRWIEKGKFILLERDKNLHRLHRGLESSHPGK